MLTNLFNKSGWAHLIALVLILSSWLKVMMVSDAVFDWGKLGLFVVMLGILLSHTYIIKEIFSAPSYLFLPVWGMLTWNFPEVLFEGKIILSYMLISLVFIKIYLISYDKARLLNLFDAGILGITAAVIFPESSVFIFWIYAGYALFYGILDKNIFMPVTGYISGLILFATYYLYIGKWGDFSTLWKWHFQLAPLTHKPVLIFWGLWGLWAFLSLARSEKMSATLYRKRFILIFFQAIIGLFFFLTDSEDYAKLLFVFFPLSYFLSENFLLIQNNRKKDILILIFFVLSFVMNFI